MVTGTGSVDVNVNKGGRWGFVVKHGVVSTTAQITGNLTIKTSSTNRCEHCFSDLLTWDPDKDSCVYDCKNDPNSVGPVDGVTDSCICI